MITQKYITELNRLSKKANTAEDILRGYRLLDIEANAVELKDIIHEYEVAHQIVLDYLFSFIPKELVNKLSIRRTTGAFVTDITGKISFHAELVLYLTDDTIRLKFDNENKCLYYQSWLENEYYSELLKQYLNDNSGFDAWIRFD